MFARYVSAIASGTFITVCLLFVMQSLIDMQPSALSDPRIRTTLTPIEVRKPVPVKTNDQREIIREQLTRTVLPPLRAIANGPTGGVSYSAAAPRAPSGNYSRPDFEQTDGPLVAMVRVLPVYPVRANGREGYVIVQFDVLSTGQVSNAVVYESSDHVFDKAAIKAAERSRFRARVVDGVPLTSTGIQTLYRFEMEQAQ